MPTVDQSWVEAIRQKLNEPRLDIVWDERARLNDDGTYRPRYVVIMKYAFGPEPVMFVESASGEYVRPEPGLLLHGDKDLGIQGLVELDTYSIGKDEWWNRFLRKEASQELKQKLDRKDELRTRGREWYRDNLQTKAFVRRPW